MQFFDTFLTCYGWEGIALAGAVLAMFGVQLYYYIFVYGRIPGYKNNRRPAVLEADPQVSVVIPLFSEDYSFVEERLPLILAQNLLPELGKYKLDIVAEYLHLPAFNHHRASDDAATVGYMLVPFFEMLRDRGVHTLQQINPAMARLRTGGKARRQPKHLIVLAKNQLGLRNLYKLIFVWFNIDRTICHRKNLIFTGCTWSNQDKA